MSLNRCDLAGLVQLRAAHRGVGDRHAHEHRGRIKYDGAPRRAAAYFFVVVLYMVSSSTEYSYVVYPDDDVVA